MITRDNAASLTGTAQNARQRLGELIAFYMNDSQCDDRRVARTCSASPRDVEQWRKGELVPSSDQWSKLKRSVSHALGRYAEVYQRARTEAESEARERAKRTDEERQARERHQAPTPKVGTNLGDKLVNLSKDQTAPPGIVMVSSEPVLHVVPPPSTSAHSDLGVEPRGLAADGRKLSPMRPSGSGTTSQVDRRKAFVRELLAAFPDKRTSGADSVIALVRKTFGIGISPETVDEIREELRTMRIKAEVRADVMREVTQTMPIVTTAPPFATPEHVAAVQALRQTEPAPLPRPGAADLSNVAQTEPTSEDLSTAVQLILEALPGLQTFTISVDDTGEASVDYQIRKVKIETVGGSIKVKR